MATLDELKPGDVDPGAAAATVTEAAGKPRRRNIFGRATKVGEPVEPRKHRVVLRQNLFGRVTEEIQVKDPVAATHWDVRLWRRLR